MAAEGVKLAGLMEEAGPGANVESLLARVPPPSEQAMAEVAALLARLPDAWDAEKVGTSLRIAAASAPDLSKVAAALREGALGAIGDAAGVRALAGAWRGLSGGPHLPGAIFLGQSWPRSDVQASALRLALAAPPGLLDWEVPGSQAQHQYVSPLPPSSPMGAPWVRRDVYDTLAALARAGHAREALASLESVVRAWPELVARGVAAVREGWGAELGGLLGRVLDATPAPGCLDVASRAAAEGRLTLEPWLAGAVAARGPDLLQDCLVYVETRLSQRSKDATGSALSSSSSDTLSAPVLAAFFGVLAMHAHALPPAALTSLERVRRLALDACPGLLAVLQQQQLQYETGPSTAVNNSGGPETPVAGFGEDVEAEANATFQRVYTGALSVAELVEDLQRMAGGSLAPQSSPSSRQRRLFDCVVHNLFDEYRFLPRYPERELELTAELWGMVISRGLVTGPALAVALRSVLDALERHPPGSKMRSFGLSAARHTRSLLKQWPEFAARLVVVSGIDPGLRDASIAALAANSNSSSSAIGTATTPDDKKGLEASSLNGAGLSGLPGAAPTLAAAHEQQQQDTSRSAATTPARQVRPSSAMAGPVATDTATPGDGLAPAFLSTINADSLEAAVARDVDYAVPSQNAMDRVHFLVNNLTRSNVADKLAELKSLVTPEFYPWFVTYVTVKRAAQEPNFHDTYVALIDAWGDRGLSADFVRAAIKYSRVILDSPAAAQFSDRALLRHLGSFLGKLTLAKNRPVLQRDLDLRELLLSAYETGRLHPILIFVRYLLEAGLGSRVFCPPNPWFMSIIRLMAEIFRLPGLKSSLHFEVELVCKNAGLAVREVTPSDLLRFRRPPPNDSPDFVTSSTAGLATPDRSMLGLGPTSLAYAGLGTPNQQPVVGSSLLATPLQQQQSSSSQLALLGTPPPPPPPAYGAASPAPLASPALLGPTTPGVGPGAALVGMPSTTTAGQQQSTAPPPPLPADAVALFEQVAPRLVVPKQLEQYERLGLRSVLVAAAERAVRDVLEPVVDRARSISCITAKSLVLKDYAAEPDAERVRRAAVLSARGLAASLALVTAREPLRTRLKAHLGTALPPELEGGPLDALAGDNMAIVCAVIEGVAAARAAADVDARVAPALSSRRVAASAGIPWDGINKQQQVDRSGVNNTTSSSFPAALPPSLRPGPIVSLGHAANVYEEFARVPHTMMGSGSMGAQEGAGGISASTSATSSALQQQVPTVSASTTASGPVQTNSLALRTQFAAWVARLDAAAVSEAATSGNAGANATNTTTACSSFAAVPALLSRQSELWAVANEVASLLPVGIDTAALLEIARTILAKAFVGPGAGAGPVLCRAHAAAHVAALESIRDSVLVGGSNKHGGEDDLATTGGETSAQEEALCNEITRVFLNAVVEEGRAARELGELLVQARLLSLPAVDVVLAKALHSGGPRAGAAGDLVLGLLQAACHCCASASSTTLSGGGLRSASPPLTTNPAETLVNTTGGGTVNNASSQQQANVSRTVTPPSPTSTSSTTPPLAQHPEVGIVSSSQFASSSPNLAGSSSSRPAITAYELTTCSDALSRLAARLPQGAGALALVAEARRLAVVASAGPQGVGLPGVAPISREALRDAPLAVEIAMKALDRWVRVCSQPDMNNGGMDGTNNTSTSTMTTSRVAFFSDARSSGLLTPNGTSLTPVAARIMTQLAVQHALRAEVVAASNGATGRSTLGYQAVDALARLVASLARGGEGSVQQTNGLAEFLGVLAGVLIKDADERGPAFNGRPYFRLVLGLMVETLPSAEEAVALAKGDSGQAKQPNTSTDKVQMRLRAFGTFLFTVRPQRVPSFAFSWLHLLGERRFLPVLLASDNSSLAGPRRPSVGSMVVLQLLLAQLAFLGPALKSGEQTEGARRLLRGTLRVLLVILHDFSEFLCRHAPVLAAAVPPPLLQMRNLILSAFPRGLSLPDPFTSGLAGAEMPGGAKLPPGASPPETLLPPGLRLAADKALSAGSGAVNEALVSTLLAALGDSVVADSESSSTGKLWSTAALPDFYLQESDAVEEDPTSPVFMPRMPSNTSAPFKSVRQAAASLAVYICLHAATESNLNASESQLRAPPKALPTARDIELLAAVLRGLDPPACAAAIAAIIDQLRFPSTHTAAVSASALGLFARATASDEMVLEQVTRGMLERLIATRPHPWGLLVTFIELLKNVRYGFRTHDFTRCAPDIDRLFDSLTKSAGSQGGAMTATA